MSQPNIFALPQSTIEEPIQEGDAVLIIRRDGEITPMTVGINQNKVDSLKEKDFHEMSDEELDLMLQGQKLFLLSMAAKSEEIMDFLARVAATTGASDMEKMSRAIRPN